VIKNASNQLVVGTILDGIQVLDSTGKKILHLNNENGLQSNTIHGISEDLSGNIWLALNKGIDFISLYHNADMVHFRDLNIGALQSAALFNNELYLGTNQGLYKRPWDKTNDPFVLVPNTQDQVWDCKRIDNNLFVGHNSGTFIITPEGIRLISNISGGYSMVRNPQNPDQMIQSSYSNLVVYSKASGNWKYSHIIPGFSNLIRYIEFDHRNYLWASHLYQGIYRIKLNSNLDSLIERKNYGNAFVAKETEGHRNYVFKVENRIVITSGNLLFTYDDLNDSIVPYSQLNEGLGEYAKASRIVAAPENRYWFIAPAGFACFEISFNSIRLIREYPIALFEEDIIPLQENLVPIDRDQVLVCLDNGYVILNTAREEKQDVISRHSLQIRNIQSEDVRARSMPVVPGASRARIPNQYNNLTVRYSFPLFSAENMKYQYRVDGLDYVWSTLYDQPIFTIRRIPPGNYTLEARAVNPQGNVSQVTRIEFEILKPWYRSILAFIAYFLIVSTFLFIYSQYSIKQNKLKELRFKREKEKELIRLRNEKLRSELSLKSNQLANSTLGIIKKNEFLMDLKEKLKRQKESLGTRYPDKYYQSLVKRIDENISGQDDWKVFEANFNQAHETFLKNLKDAHPDLTSSDLRLCAYLRINLTSKEIAPLLGISVRGVENHRYRLRKKLNIDPESKLTDFILSF